MFTPQLVVRKSKTLDHMPFLEAMQSSPEVSFYINSESKAVLCMFHLKCCQPVRPLSMSWYTVPQTGYALTLCVCRKHKCSLPHEEELSFVCQCLWWSFLLSRQILAERIWLSIANHTIPRNKSAVQSSLGCYITCQLTLLPFYVLDDRQTS